MKRISMIVAALAGAACGNEDPGRLPQSLDPVAVTVSAERRAPSLESYPARIESEHTAEIATRMSGTVTSVDVEVGSTVSAGQTLFTIDAADVTARVAAARAQRALAERSFGRMERLAADGAASQQELDQARAGLEAARAAVTEAEAQQAYAVVRAPFAGVVTRRSVDPGDLAVPGMPLLTVVSPSALKVVADLPAHRSGALAAGTVVGVSIDGATGSLDARITRVVPALGEGSRTFRVEAEPVGTWSGPVPGAYARMILSAEEEGPRWLPVDAIVERGQLTGVYAVEGDTLRLRWVRLGRERDGAVELLAGPLTPLTVVREPSPQLFDGQPVSRAESRPWAVPGAASAEVTTTEAFETDGVSASVAVSASQELDR